MKVLLYDIYRAMKKEKNIFTLNSYFDFVIPPSSMKKNIALETKGKYVREGMTKDIKKYFRNKNNRVEIEKHLEDLVAFLAEGREVFIRAILNTLREYDEIEVANKLDELLKNNKISDVNFYYYILRFCMTNEFYYTEDSNNINRSLLELDEKILTQYGISGNTGKNVILQLASMGSRNPYILFEAGEIEYIRRFATKDKTENHLERAYEYYKKASELGFALADWSLGYLAQMCSQKAWNIREFDYMTKEQLIERAIYYYKKAARENCSKAYNSLGNIAKMNKFKLNHNLKSPKEYYYQSAIRNNIFGMYNYARILEDEIRVKIIRKQYSNKAKKENIIKNGKEMMEYFDQASTLGYPEASYRCALYYGHLFDDKIAMDEQFHLVEIDKVRSIKYLHRAIKTTTYRVCLNAYIILLEYILNDDKGLFENSTDLQKVDDYFEILENGKYLTKNQEEKIKRLKDLWNNRNVSGKRIMI